jgi:2-methylcitrate dehydratase
MAASFSTVPARKGDAVASPAASRDFDPEIVDMANYIHNYNIDSDLAVSFCIQSFHSFAVVY